jgi:hypothetical protein
MYARDNLTADRKQLSPSSVAKEVVSRDDKRIYM